MRTFLFATVAVQEKFADAACKFSRKQIRSSFVQSRNQSVASISITMLQIFSPSRRAKYAEGSTYCTNRSESLSFQEVYDMSVAVYCDAGRSSKSPF